MGERADEIMQRDPMDRSSYSSGYLGSDEELPTGDEFAGNSTSPDVTWRAPAADAGTSYGLDAETDGSMNSYAESADEVETTRVQIEQTRSELGDTIDAIQQKLSPQNMMQDAKDTVREATVGKAEAMVSNVGDTAKGFSSTVIDTIRDNPVPVALAGISLGWLLMKGRDTGGNNDKYRQYRYRPGAIDGYPAYGDGSSYSRDASQMYGSASNRTDGQAQGLTGNLADSASGAMNTVSDKAGQVADGVQNAANTATSAAGQAVDHAQYGAQQAMGGFQQMLQERPLAVAAGAVAVGIAVGLAIPETPQEDHLMGEARDSLMDQAQQAVQQTAQKVQNVAQEAVGAAKDEAQNQNLM